MRSESEKNFWRLLADYEVLTQQESVAIRHENFPALIEAQRLKTSIFPGWLQLGAQLGMSREAVPELNDRLDGLSAIENENLLGLAAIKESARKRIVELSQARVRLQHVRRNYHENEIPDATPVGFVAHG